MDLIMKPWPWWISGPLIGLTVPILFLLAGRSFGISTSLQQLGAMCTGSRGPAYLSDYNWRKGFWLIFFVVGISLGGWIGSHLISHEPPVLLPERFESVWGGLQLFVGGILIGLGARYAGGCTSGHSITGIANLNGPSVVATIFFFAGGLFVTWLVLRPVLETIAKGSL